ncbi:MAG: hypothetical protein QM654_05015 [Dysgonamonadaceae bacterium]
MQKGDRSIKNSTAIDKNTEVYFRRTNVCTFDEQTTWEYYNLIREIEYTNKELETGLNLHPIYHRSGSRSDAHLFFGLLAYWIVWYDTLSTKTIGRKPLLDRNSETYIYAETGDHTIRQCFG